MTRRDRVEAAFSGAAATYDAAAAPQARAAGRLAELVLAAGLPASPRVLELGCGTGLLTRRLLGSIAGGSWLITDLSAAMVEATRANLDDASLDDNRVTVRVMDAERPDLPLSSVDLIVSNLAAQWFTDLPGTLARLSGLLAPGGRMMLSTLGAGTFAEWRQAHDRLGLACGTPAYPDATALAAMAPAGVRAQILSEPFAVSYPDAAAFLAALKAIGAGTPRPGYTPLPAGSLRRVMAGLGGPCSVTYDVLYAEFLREPVRPAPEGQRHPVR